MDSFISLVYRYLWLLVFLVVKHSGINPSFCNCSIYLINCPRMYVSFSVWFWYSTFYIYSILVDIDHSNSHCIFVFSLHDTPRIYISFLVLLWYSTLYTNSTLSASKFSLYPYVFFPLSYCINISCIKNDIIFFVLNLLIAHRFL